MLVALAAALTAGPALAAKEKPEQPKEKKLCRAVQMPGRITPQKICRKVERPAPAPDAQREERDPGGAVGRGD